jgi:hypothetical protein
MSNSIRRNNQASIDILETSPDNGEKLHAMELFKDTHLVKLELLSNATTIDSALNYIRSKQQEHKKMVDLDSTSNDSNNSDSQQYSRPCFDEIYLLLVFLGTICFNCS